MTTALSIIQDAAAELGEYADDTALSAESAQRVRRRLNRMLESWAAERLMVYAMTQVSLTMVVGQGTYATSSLTPATRPVSVHTGFTRIDNADRPFRITTDEVVYDTIAMKTTTGLPELCYYRASFPTGQLNFWPTPVAAYTAYFEVSSLLSDVLELADDLTLPPGYERAIVFNLAVEAASAFGTTPPDAVVALAKESKATVKRSNWTPATMRSSLNPYWTKPNIIAGE